MKNRLRLIVLAGVLALSWFALETPSYAIVDCSTREGQACLREGISGLCTSYDEELQCTWIYTCWCDRAFGPLQWRCGSSPTGQGTC